MELKTYGWLAGWPEELNEVATVSSGHTFFKCPLQRMADMESLKIQKNMYMV